MAQANPPKELSGVFLSLFGLPFLAGGLAISWLYFDACALWWQSQHWQEVPAWIDAVELEHHGKNHEVKAQYRYEYNGVTYHGDQVSFHPGSDHIGNFHQQTYRELSQYAPATSAQPPPPFRCYVNPAKPDRAVLYRTLRWPVQAFLTIFMLTFPAVGAGLVACGLITARSQRRERALRNAYPDEPWKWKTSWAGPAIPETSTIWRKVLYLYTLWSGVVIALLITTTALSGEFQQDQSAWLLWIFVALWSIAGWFSLKQLRHQLTVGTTRFELAETPVQPGRLLRGHVLLEKPLPLRESASVELVCDKLTSVTFQNRTSTTREQVWSHQQDVPVDLISRDLSGYRLPVELSVPADAPTTDASSDPDIKHEWKLHLRLPGSAIHSAFEVPVFALPGTSSPTTDVLPNAQVPSVLTDTIAELPARLAVRRIRLELDAAGLPVMIDCPAARHRGNALFLVLFNLLWTAAAVFLLTHPAPLLFRIVWPVSATAIWLAVFWNLLHQRQVAFSANSLTVTNRLGPWVANLTIEKLQIDDFFHFSNASNNQTRFYQVRVRQISGKKLTLVDSITESATAKALVALLEKWRQA